MSDPASGAAAAHRLLLLRHGEVTSHHGDVPVTPEGLQTAREVGRKLAAESRTMHLLHGGTRRTRETVEALGAGAAAEGAETDIPRGAFALRNPDIYVAGERVNMVSSAEALAEQVPGMTAEEAGGHPFFAPFLRQPDRIGWWLSHSSVPGDDAAAVARRIDAFARSLADPGGPTAPLTVAVTHSPVLRSCALAHLGQDPGEPPWVTGLQYLVHEDRSLRVSWFSTR